MGAVTIEVGRADGDHRPGGDRAAAVGGVGQPSPDLAWLVNPALTEVSATEWDSLISTLMGGHGPCREAALTERRGHRPRLRAPGAGRRPVLTLADRLLATILHQRLGLPQAAIAALFAARRETICRHISQTRRLLQQAGYVIQPGSRRISSLADLYGLAAAEGVVISAIQASMPAAA
jgi:hypothetical protein